MRDTRPIFDGDVVLGEDWVPPMRRTARYAQTAPGAAT